jgi:hypothetical protein
MPFIISAEMELLHHIHHNLYFPTADDFLRIFFFITPVYVDGIAGIGCTLRDMPASRIGAVNFAKAASTMAHCVTDYQVVRFANSELAAGIFFGVFSDIFEERPGIFESITGYTREGIQDCLGFLARFSSNLTSTPDSSDSQNVNELIHLFT